MRRMYSKEQLIKLIKENGSSELEDITVTENTSSALCNLNHSSIIRNDSKYDKTNKIYYYDFTINVQLVADYSDNINLVNLVSVPSPKITEGIIESDGVDYFTTGHAVVTVGDYPLIKFVPVFLKSPSSAESATTTIDIVPSSLAGFTDLKTVAINVKMVVML